jgi:hypothetical protein
MRGGFVCDEKTTSQKGRFRFDPAIIIPFAVAIEGFAGRVAEKPVCQFMHDVASLPIRVMEIVMNDCSLHPAWNGNSGEHPFFNVTEMMTDLPE